MSLCMAVKVPEVPSAQMVLGEGVVSRWLGLG